MEGLIKASRAYEMTVNGIKEKYDEAIHIINDAILEATKIGDYAAHILFDPLPDPVLDRVYDALVAAGYEICGLSDEDIFISWEDVEADEPPTKPTAADVYTKNEVNDLPAADENTRPNSILNANNSEDLDDYERECVVKVGYLRDLVHRAARYDALEEAGVDNWEWYGDAYANACEDWEAENMIEVASKHWENLVNHGIIRV